MGAVLSEGDSNSVDGEVDGVVVGTVVGQWEKRMVVPCVKHSILMDI